MTTVLSPSPFLKFWDANGLPAAGYQLFTYSAGTTTKIATYVDSTGASPNANPIKLDAQGTANVWLQPNVAYKYVLALPTDTDPPTGNTRTTDNIIQNQLITVFGGVDTGAPNAYLLNFTASFSSYSTNPLIYWVPANNNTGASTVNVNGLGVVGIYNANGSQLGANQIVANQITGMIYQTNIANSGNSGFVLVSVGNFTGATIGTFGTETPIASAATTDLGSAAAHTVLVTGTTTITSFGSSASLSAPLYYVRFNASTTVTYNSSTLLTPGNSSIVTSAGDAALVQYLGSGAWKVAIYQYSTGSANTKIKPADTPQTSNTTLTPDPDLQTNTLAVGRYAFEIYLSFDSASAAAGFKWTNGGTYVDTRGTIPAIVSGFVNAAAYGPKIESPYANTIAYATVSTTSNSNVVLYKGSLLVQTAGTFGVSWAQNASTGSATTLRAGSYLTTTLLNTGASSTGLTHTYTSGSGTEVVPSGFNTLTIEVWSGAGGGGNSAGLGINKVGGGGGQGGGYSRSVITVTGLAGDTVPYVVGAGGSLSFPGSTSSAGGGTLPMTLMSVTGGAVGGGASGATPGAGGSGAGIATGGTAVNTTGPSGQSGQPAGIGGLGGAGGLSIAGIYGGPQGGGQGAGQGGPGTAGGNGLIIFTYST